MKKILPVLLVVGALAFASWYITSSGTNTKPVPEKATASNQDTGSPSQNGDQDGKAIGQPGQPNSGGSTTTAPAGTSGDDTADEDSDADEQEKPAAEVYKTAEEALKAVKDGSADYDDVILEQFREPGDDCTWCPEFYKSVKDLMLAPDSNEDQRSYFAEILAISGKTDNLSILVDQIKNAATPEKAEVFAQALELASGKDDIVRFLGEQLGSTSELLRESSVAAITNQSSRVAAELLYKHTVEHGDPDGYYSQGIGLGEFVPDQESMPYMQELVMKRDQYSHLALKALLNSGAPGLKMALDMLENSKDPEFDKQMTKGANDHISYEEESEKLCQQAKESFKAKAAVDLCTQALSDFASEEADNQAEPEANQ